MELLLQASQDIMVLINGIMGVMLGLTALWIYIEFRSRLNR